MCDPWCFCCDMSSKNIWEIILYNWKYESQNLSDINKNRKCLSVRFILCFASYMQKIDSVTVSVVNSFMWHSWTPCRRFLLQQCWHVKLQQIKFCFLCACTCLCVYCICVDTTVWPFSAGASAGEAQGDLQEDAGSAAARWKVPPPHRPRAGHREMQTRWLHEQERRLHQPSGAGKRKVRMRGEAWQYHIKVSKSALETKIYLSVY